MFLNATLSTWAQAATSFALIALCPAVWLLAATQLREHLCRQFVRERKHLAEEAEPDTDRARLAEPSTN